MLGDKVVCATSFRCSHCTCQPATLPQTSAPVGQRSPQAAWAHGGVQEAQGGFADDSNGTQLAPERHLPQAVPQTAASVPDMGGAPEPELGGRIRMRRWMNLVWSEIRNKDLPDGPNPSKSYSPDESCPWHQLISGSTAQPLQLQTCPAMILQSPSSPMPRDTQTVLRPSMVAFTA